MSTIITLKVDDELKAQATAVLEELGLDAPTAIRMYLKALVRENGLPMSTKLPTKPCATVSTPTAVITPTVEAAPVSLDEGKATLVKKVTVEEPVGKTVTADELFEEELPTPAVEEPTEPVVEEEKADEEPVVAEPTVTIDYDTRAGRKAIAQLFINEILSVPAGSLTRWSDMEAKLSAAYGTEVKRPQSIRWPATTDDGVEIPYWRIVGERGAVRGDKMIEQSVQEEKLKVEGHEFVNAGHGIFSGIKVEGYKEKLV